MRRWEGIVEGYLKECEVKGLSQATLKSRARELERWGVWCKRKRPRPNLEEIDSEMVMGYIKSRTVCHSKATVYGVISHMRGAGDYFVRQGYWRQNPLRWIHGPKLDWRSRLPKRVEKGQMEKIWLQAAKLRSQYQRYLWLTVLGLLYGTGMRRGELERLEVANWNRERGTLRIDGRKTGQEREVPVPETVWSCLESYLPQRHNVLERCRRQEEKALLITQGGGRLKGERVGVMIHRLARRAEVPLVTVHQFRHTCASDLLESGTSLPEVQGILGHACIQSTCRYIHIAAPERKAAMALHPINSILGAASEQEAVNG